MFLDTPAQKTCQPFFGLTSLYKSNFIAAAHFMRNFSTLAQGLLV